MDEKKRHALLEGSQLVDHYLSQMYHLQPRLAGDIYGDFVMESRDWIVVCSICGAKSDAIQSEIIVDRGAANIPHEYWCSHFKIYRLVYGVYSGLPKLQVEHGVYLAKEWRLANNDLDREGREVAEPKKYYVYEINGNAIRLLDKEQKSIMVADRQDILLYHGVYLWDREY